MKRLALVILAGAVAAACVPPAQMMPTPLIMTTSVDTAEYARYASHGSGAITGQAFLTTRGGDVKLGAGRTVTLDPLTDYAMDWYRQTGASLERFDEVPPAHAFVLVRRTSTVDAQGNFQFTNLPSGLYLLRSTVTWETGGQFTPTQGGVVADSVRVREGETQPVILNHVVTAQVPMYVVTPATTVPKTSPIPAGMPPILTQQEIGIHSFFRLGAVEGRACRSSSDSPKVNEDSARVALSASARRIKADAVMEVTCQGEQRTDACLQLFYCKGEAIRWS